MRYGYVVSNRDDDMSLPFSNRPPTVYPVVDRRGEFVYDEHGVRMVDWTFEEVVVDVERTVRAHRHTEDSDGLS